MAITVSQLKAQFTSDTADLEQGVARAARASDKAAGDISAAGARSEGAFSGLTAKAGELAGVLGGALVGAAGGAAAALLGIGAASVSFVSDSNQATNNLRAELGLSAEAAQYLGDVAENVWKNNFGASVQEAAQAVGTALNRFGDLGEAELQKVTESAFALKDVFGVEVPDSMSAAETLMENFGLSSEQAFNFIAHGFQQGLDRSGDFLDSINEYATQFSSGGASAEGFFSIMQSGLQGGMLGTDKAADAFKEFRVRIQDGSKTTADALAQLGINGAQLGAQMASGQVTAAQAFQLVTDKLRGVTDENVRMQAGVGLLGTQFEDLGTEAALAMSLTGTKISDMAGATDSLNAKYDNMGALLEGIKRQAIAAFAPIAQMAMGLASSVGGNLISSIQRVGPTIQGVASAIQGVVNIVSNSGGFMGNFDAWVAGLDAVFGTDTTNKIITFASSLSQLGQGNVSGGISGILQSLGLDESVAGQIGATVDGVVSAVQTAIGRLKTGIENAQQTLAGGNTVGAASTSFLMGLGLDPGLAASIGTAIDGVISTIQGAIGRVRTAIQNFQAGMATGSPGAATAGFLSALGIDEGLAGSIGAKVGEINAAIQTARSRIGTAISNFQAGWAQGTPGAAVSGFLSAMGLSEELSGQIGAAVGDVIATVQTAIGRLKTAIQTAASTLASGGTAGGGASALLAGLGLDPSIASQVGTAIDNVVSAVQSGIGRLQQAVLSLASGGGPTGFLQAIGLNDQTVSMIGGVVSQIGATIMVLAGNFQAGFQQAAAALAPMWPPLQQLAALVGSVVVGAFIGLIGFVAGALPGVAMVVTGVVETVNGVLQLMASFIGGIIATVGALIMGDWAGAWNAAAAMVQNMNARAQEILNGLNTAALGIVRALVGGIVSAFQGLYTAITGEQMPNLVNGVSEWFNQMKTRAGEFMEALRADVVAKFEALRVGAIELAQQLIDGVAGAWRAGVAVATAAVEDLASQALNVLTSAVGSWADAGRGLVNSMAEGIQSAAAGVINKVRDMVQAARDLLPGSDAKEGPLSDLTDSGRAFGTTFAAGMAMTLPVIVTNVRSVLEQVNAVLDGIGGAISNSRFEKFRDAAAALADGLTAISDAAKLFSGAGMAALSSVADKIRTFALDAKALLVSIDLSGIGAISNEKFEQFAAGLKELASGMASIASIGATFSDKVQMPNLRALTDRIRLLVMDALALLAAIDIVVPVIGETLATRLKALGEAASGAKSVAENAFGLIKLLAETLAFDFGGVDWSTAYHNLIGLARAALIYVQALDPVTLVVSDELIAKLRSLGDGVGAVKAIAENTFGLIKVLVDTLAFDFGAPDWSRAWHNLMGLMQAAITYADAALRLADTFTGVVSGAATELGKALQLTVGIIQNAFDMLTFLEDVEVPLTPFLYLLVKLGQVIPLASRVSEAFLLIASQFTGIVTVAATELGKALALAVGTIRDALVVITGLAEADISAWVVIPLLSFMVKIGQIIPLASNIASMVTELASRFTGQVTPAAEELGRALSSSLGILTGSLKLISFFTEDLAEGPDPNAIDRSTIKAVLTSLLKFGIEVAQTAVTVVGNLRLVVKPALDAVGQALAGTFDALSGALDVAALLTSDDLIDTRGLADQVKSKLVALLKFGISIAQTANAVIGNLKLVVKPALDALGATLSSTFDALSGALDVATLLTDDELPDIKGLAALVKPKITAILKFGIEVAQAANAVIGNLKIAVKPALDALGATLSSTFDALSGALDIASLLTGDELPETKGLTALVRTRLTGILRFGIEVAQTANAVIGNLKIVVKPALDALGTTLSNVFDALSGSLDIAALMTGDKLPDVKELGPLVKMRLASLLKFGIDIAQAANAVIGNLKIVVKPALANLGTVLGDTLGVIKEVLDFSELTDEIASFRGFDMSVIGPKLALIFSAAVAIAKEFGRRASTSGIKEAWVEAGAALSSLFGDAASTLKDALDLGAALLDPETQIPSIGQIQGKVDALFNIIQGVAAQFAARASAAANAGMNFEQVGSFAETVKAVFEGIREVAAAIADFTGVSLGASGFNNIAQVLNAVFTLFEQVAGRASVVNQVSAAIASVLGGLAALVDAQAYQAGVDIGTRIADGIAAGLRNGLENLNPMPGGGDDKNKGTTPNAGGGGGGNVIYIYNIDNSKNITISQVINTTPENVGKAAGGWYPLLAGY